MIKIISADSEAHLQAQLNLSGVRRIISVDLVTLKAVIEEQDNTPKEAVTEIIKSDKDGFLSKETVTINSDGSEKSREKNGRD